MRNFLVLVFETLEKLFLENSYNNKKPIYVYVKND